MATVSHEKEREIERLTKTDLNVLVCAAFDAANNPLLPAHFRPMGLCRHMVILELGTGPLGYAVRHSQNRNSCISEEERSTEEDGAIRLALNDSGEAQGNIRVGCFAANAHAGEMAAGLLVLMIEAAIDASLENAQVATAA